jgi:hypothetical protein
MLAASRDLKMNGQYVTKTPLVVPSFSSKGFPDVGSIVKALSGTISEGVLVSAYDFYKGKLKEIPSFPSYIILDSGGYECSDCRDLSDTNMENYKNVNWDYDDLISVLDGWNASVPTFSVSYDHPKVRCSVEEQIAKANSQFTGRALGKFLLIKPSTRDASRVSIEDVIKSRYDLHRFDAIGFTEKELGYSIFERMKAIGKMRMALAEAGINIPIHIFGSLDMLSVPLYFMAGADIFDGLTWLRYYYSDDGALYLRTASALKYGTRENDSAVPPKIWASNYNYLMELASSLKRCLREDIGTVFGGGQRGAFFEKEIKSLYAELGVDNGR